jgi:hypothetical protein
MLECFNYNIFLWLVGVFSTDSRNSDVYQLW